MPIYALLSVNLMRLVVLFHVKDAIESFRPFARLAVIAQYDAIENEVSPIFPLVQITKGVFHPTLP